VVAAYGQRFIVRRPSPALTVGGGVVLDPSVPQRSRAGEIERRGRALASADELDRLSAFLAEQNQVEHRAIVAACKTGIAPSRYDACVAELFQRGMLQRLERPSRGRLLHVARIAGLTAAMMKRIHQEIERQRPRRAVPRQVLLSACRGVVPADLLEPLFAYLLQIKRLVTVGENVGPADAQVRLSKNQIEIRRRILERISEGGLMPPNQKELAVGLGQKEDAVGVLLELCVEQGELVDVGEGLFYRREELEWARRVCQKVFERDKVATVSQLREAWGVSRKYAFPLCGWFDGQGITVRVGDVHQAGPQIATPIAGG
jgi:selenocysteine-specific elongation factor